jgi:transcriptional regulator with XRE-family HTH domain
MSEQPIRTGAPEWDAADRMRKALREANLGVAEMAAYLGVSRTSVSNWINGRVEPSVQTLRLWALRTGVPFEWLSSEMGPKPRGGMKAQVRPWSTSAKKCTVTALRILTVTRAA